MLEVACGEKWESVVILIRRRTAAERFAEVQLITLAAACQGKKAQKNTIFSLKTLDNCYGGWYNCFVTLRESKPYEY